MEKIGRVKYVRYYDEQQLVHAYSDIVKIGVYTENSRERQLLQQNKCNYIR